jgi:6-phosphogluconolactonase
MNNSQIKIFLNAEELAAAFAQDFCDWSRHQLKGREHLTVALSGGSTPKRLFEIWAELSPNNAPSWNQMHFFWGDERCVPPTDPESNFGVAHQIWLSKIKIEANQIHPICGQNDPRVEQARYSEEIRKFVQAAASKNPGFNPPLPQFDLVILGMGSDGHVASIFPNRLDLFDSSDLCAVATHPISGQRRITLTGPAILAAHRIVFLIAGRDKAAVLKQVIHRSGEYERYPASRIVGPAVEYFLDESAAADLY